MKRIEFALETEKGASSNSTIIREKSQKEIFNQKSQEVVETVNVGQV